MKKTLPLFILFFHIGFCFGQNLVPNPSFEDTVSCPDGLAQVDRAVGWSSVRESPDYYNACAPTGGISVSVPQNWIGFQYAASGKGYTGLYAKAGAINYREYVGTKLTDTLQTGTKYYVSFKVNLSNFGQSGYCAVNKLGVLFSTMQYSVSDTAPICNCAQVYTDSIITDTLNWIRINGSFIADLNYSFINIGNFFDDSLTNFKGMGTGIAYYYVDDICVSTDSTYAYNYTYVGINRLETEKSIRYYPNPFKELITIEDYESDIEVLKLYNIYGQLLRIQEGNRAQYYTWNLSDLPNGIYTLTFQNKNLISSNHIIIKY